MCVYVLFTISWTNRHHQMVNTKIRLIIFFVAKDGEALYSQPVKTRSWLWLRSWLTYCQIQTWIEEIGESTRPFRYDLNQVRYDYTLEVANEFKGLDLIECLKNYGWRFVTLYRRHGSRPPPRKRNLKKQNDFFWGGLKNSCERREVKSKGEKEKYNHLNTEFQRIARRDKKAFLSDQCKKKRGKQ